MKLFCFATQSENKSLMFYILEKGEFYEKYF